MVASSSSRSSRSSSTILVILIVVVSLSFSAITFLIVTIVVVVVVDDDGDSIDLDDIISDTVGKIQHCCPHLSSLLLLLLLKGENHKLLPAAESSTALSTWVVIRVRIHQFLGLVFGFCCCWYGQFPYESEIEQLDGNGRSRIVSSSLVFHLVGGENPMFDRIEITTLRYAWNEIYSSASDSCRKGSPVPLQKNPFSVLSTTMFSGRKNIIDNDDDYDDNVESDYE